MTAYVIFTRERVRDESEMAKYGELAGPSFAGHEFKVLAAYGECETVEGAEVAGAVVLEFPTLEAAKAWYGGPEYSAARKHRQLGADYRAFIVQGV